MGKDKSEAGENIKVAVRVRPLFAKEIERGDHTLTYCRLAPHRGSDNYLFFPND